MKNFNTNQTRHFYVAAQLDESNAPDSSSFLAKSIVLKQAKATGELYFIYKNADGILTRSDSFLPERITSLKKTASADMATPLQAFKVQVDTGKITLSNYVGKTINLVITLHQIFDYDESNSITIVASVVGDSTNTSSAAAFYKAMAKAVVKALPANLGADYPVLQVVMHKSGTDTVITASTPDSSYMADATDLILIQGKEKYVRGKLSGEPCTFSVASNADELNASSVAIGKKDWHKIDAANNVGVYVSAASVLESGTAASLKVIPANYALADLEYFALGERGDVYRGANWPNNYEPTYVIDPKGATAYDVLTVEFYWAGGNTNVQKSPRLIQIAAPHNASPASDICTKLFDQISAAMAGVASS